MATTIVGKDTAGASTEGLASNILSVYKYTATRTQSSSTIKMYLAGGANARNLRAVVYSDSAGAPNNLLGSSLAVTLGASAPAAWVTFTLQAAVSFVSGTVYHLGWWKESAGSEGTHYNDGGSINDQHYKTVTYDPTADPPNPITATTGDSRNGSVYAEGASVVTHRPLAMMLGVD